MVDLGGFCVEWLRYDDIAFSLDGLDLVLEVVSNDVVLVSTSPRQLSCIGEKKICNSICVGQSHINCPCFICL